MLFCVWVLRLVHDYIAIAFEVQQVFEPSWVFWGECGASVASALDDGVFGDVRDCRAGVWFRVDTARDEFRERW